MLEKRKNEGYHPRAHRPLSKKKGEPTHIPALCPPIEPIGVVAGKNNFTLLVAALNLTGLIDAVNDPEAELTVFAPEDEAFLDLGDELDRLMANPDELKTILLNHVISGTISSSALFVVAPQSPINVPTLSEGQSVNVIVDTSAGAISLEGLGNVESNIPSVIATDLRASNGIIHAIDGIILPRTA